MSLSPSQTDDRFGARVLRGNAGHLDTAVLSQQLEPCGPGDADAVDPRLRDRSIEEGRRIGFAQGYEDGMQAASTQVMQLKSATDALREAAIAFQNQEIDLLGVAEDEILDAVFSLAYTVLQKEVSLQESPGREAIKRALTLAPNGQNAVAYLNPIDAEKIETNEIEAGGRVIKIVANDQIQVGGCILEVGPTRIDTQIHVALERMREVL